MTEPQENDWPPKTRPCIYCEQDVYWEVDRLVMLLSGNDGGTYDWCDTSPDNNHHTKPTSTISTTL